VACEFLGLAYATSAAISDNLSLRWCAFLSIALFTSQRPMDDQTLRTTLRFTMGIVAQVAIFLMVDYFLNRPKRS
jgi:hypothetical protein